jgi:hypothetical protein
MKIASQAANLINTDFGVLGIWWKPFGEDSELNLSPDATDV